ncbi:MAG: pyrroline-5-carboxylate reductase [Alphaproteobacteria bacterium]|nr:pyrroline-5-carboxylate reductase [Alphaproteobacteria bacterium]
MEFTSEHPLLIIGGGNMGTALATRWRQWSPLVVESSSLRRGILKDEGIESIESLAALTTPPRAAVLAVKPQSYHEIKPALAKWPNDTLVISIMAGVPLGALPKNSVRVMPNTPALVGQGMSVCCGPTIAEEDQRIVQDLFAAGGEVCWVNDEEQMHAVTAISGSGPAYVFAFMEALERAAIHLGLDAQTAHLLVKQTVFGSACMANTPFADVSKLREQVTSKGGTTEAALAVLLPSLQTLIEATAQAAESRSKALSS